MYYNYDSKHLSFTLGDSSIFDPVPKIYLDFFKSKANLKLSWNSWNSLNIILGAFGYELYIEFKWGHVERPMNERELERMEDVRKLVESLKDPRPLKTNQRFDIFLADEKAKKDM